MPFEIRAVEPGEVDELLTADRRGFGGEPPRPGASRSWTTAELDRSRAAFESGRMVGVSRTYSFELTMPGGAFLPVAAVSWVSVLPTHRRRGVLTQLMAAMHDDAREHDEPAAILTASEGSIYGRFGYGLATFKASIDIERARAGFREHHILRGTFRLLDSDEATAACRPIYDRYLTMRAGAFSRNDGWWRAEFIHDPERRRRGGGPAFFLLHETDGVADAYARYRMHGDWDDRGAKGAIDVRRRSPSIRLPSASSGRTCSPSTCPRRRAPSTCPSIGACASCSANRAASA